MFDPRDLIERLTGARPISGSTVIVGRGTPTDRAAARDYLLTVFASMGLGGKLHSYSTTARGPGDNVYAELPATGAGTEWVVLGAHYDSKPGSPGANDNATGVAVVFSVAERMAAHADRSRSFIFVLFDQEEGDPATMTALVGSSRFASLLISSKRTFDSVHTVDQLGWDADGDRTVELEKPTVALRALYEGVAKSFAPAIPTRVTTTSGSDHESFRARGFPAIGLTEEYAGGDTTPHFHKSTNTADTVNWAYLASCTSVVERVMRELAK